MILFFYGEDTYASRQKTQALKEKFLSSHPASGLVICDAGTLSPGDLATLFASQDLWASHRLIIVRDALGAQADIRDELSDLLESIPESITLLVWESGSPDRRLKLFTRLLAIAKSQEFSGGKGQTPLAYTQGLLSAHGISLAPAQVSELTRLAQIDNWMLATEIEKLATAPDKRLIPGLISRYHSLAEFALQDAIAKRSAQEAVAVIATQISQNPGEAPLLIGALAAQLRTLYLLSVPRTASTATKLHPFVVRKLTPLATSHPPAYWEELILSLSQLDWHTKTGLAQAEAGLLVGVAKITA